MLLPQPDQSSLIKSSDQHYHPQELCVFSGMGLTLISLFPIGMMGPRDWHSNKDLHASCLLVVSNHVHASSHGQQEYTDALAWAQLALALGK